jgi:hypothetical protein
MSDADDGKIPTETQFGADSNVMNRPLVSWRCCPDNVQTNDSAKPQNMRHIYAHEALQIGLILSQQEQEFGTNMYQSLTPEDEPEIERLNALGFSAEEAILHIFDGRFISRKLPAGAAGMPVVAHRSKLEEEQRAASTVRSNPAVVVAQRRTADSRLHPPTRNSPPVRPDAHGGSASELLATPDRTSTRVSPVPFKPADVHAASSFEKPREKVSTGVPMPPLPPHTAAHASTVSNYCKAISSAGPHALNRMSSAQMLQLRLQLSQQEAEYGADMYEALEECDEPAIQRLISQGYSQDEAVLRVFHMKMGAAAPVTPLLGAHRPEHAGYEAHRSFASQSPASDEVTPCTRARETQSYAPGASTTSFQHPTGNRAYSPTAVSSLFWFVATFALVAEC